MKHHKIDELEDTIRSNRDILKGLTRSIDDSSQRLRELESKLRDLGANRAKKKKAQDGDREEYEKVLLDLVRLSSDRILENSKTREIDPLAMVEVRIVKSQDRFGAFADDNVAILGEKSATIRFPRMATVEMVLDEASRMWAFPRDSMLGMVDGAVVSERSRLGKLADGLSPDGSRPGIPTIYVANFPQAQKTIKRREAFQTIADIDFTREDQLQALEDMERERLLLEIKTLTSEVGHGVGGKAFLIRSKSEVIRDLVLFILVLAFFFVGYMKPIASDFVGSPYNSVLSSKFVVKTGPNTQRTVDFYSIKTSKEIYAFVNDVLRTSLLGTMEAQSPFEPFPYWMVDNSQREVIGVLRFRQLRVRPNVTCTVSDKASQVVDACFNNYSEENRDVDTFGNEQVVFTPGFEFWSNSAIQSQVKLDQNYYTKGYLADYPNSGYVIDVGTTFRQTGNVSDLTEDYDQVLNKLRSNRWIDAQTRAVIISYNFYVGGADLYRSMVLLFEQKLAGDFVTSARQFRFSYEQILPRGVSAVSQVVLGFLMLFLTVQKIFHVRYYWFQMSNLNFVVYDIHFWLDWLAIVFYIVIISLQISIFTQSEEYLTVMWNDMENYYSLENLYSLVYSYQVVEGVFSVLIMLRVLLQLRLFKTGAVLLHSLGSTSKSLIVISIVFSPIFVTFALILWQLAGTRSLDFATLGDTFITITVKLNSVFDRITPELLSWEVLAPWYAWYVVLWITTYLFLVRYYFVALAVVFGIHHFVDSYVEYKFVTKRLDKLRKQYYQLLKKSIRPEATVEDQEAARHKKRYSCQRFIHGFVKLFDVKGALKLDTKHAAKAKDASKARTMK